MADEANKAPAGEEKIPFAPAPNDDLELPVESAEQTAHQGQIKLIQEIMGKETFIDPLNSEQITKAYAHYDRSSEKMMEVLLTSFKTYCRKSIREAALIRVKNEVATMLFDEAEMAKRQAVEELSKHIQTDEHLERLLAMLLFKNHFWNWLRFGLKEIFKEQRAQPGHQINQYLNRRFHRLKGEKGFHTVADLINHDLTEIVNTFKSQVMKSGLKIFDPPQQPPTT